MVDYNIQGSVCLKCMLMWFLSCLYGAVGFSSVREQRFIKVIIII